ncbi:hypothetical protein [Marinomonas mediterranea]|jgi:hypothetical protein|uniref:Uncharacterized protein n=1 Tax=Marinomonas mediterranea (strain ATCC 700492 / JCM 21426 / NBRC 103028 / MMB-1) TaxID=717774 RepID=F2K4Z9_MARM1|nr:hypothetical protein [Marinomonas mediterranea]ADZ92642.1 hypothetical protein Marme_3426 [Marinomonas mediterranea MMB-1]WCN10582.1 hypothetical protein GV055_17450 [Marinomonas mediterranea]WCN14631.1 hypothetical protein GV054_17275 [Marinomonas mediterranea]WCN18678.1 hypothetical protein GV053_17340 [Marinomonas mediterranea MMB-1]
MQTYTVLKREHITRAETVKEDVQHLKICGYVEKTTVEANSPEEAVEHFLAHYNEDDEKPVRSRRRRIMLWLGSAIAVMWFSYLGFVLLPMAF